jgi:hypothetical protein
MFDPETLVGFLSPAQITSLQGIIGQGLKTAEQFFDVTVQFRERSDVTGKYADVGEPVKIITISFGLREVRNSTGAPILVRSSSGDMRLWEGTWDAQVGQRFIFEGEVVEISAVYPPQNGFFICELKLVQS